MALGRRAIFLSLLLIPLLAFLAQAHVLTEAGKTWMTRADNPSTWYPRLQFAARWVAQDVIPLWDPFTNAGRPVAGDLQSGLWYLPSWILFATADPVAGIPFDAFDYFLLAHLIIGALGIFVAICHRGVLWGLLAAVIWIGLDVFHVFPKDFATATALAWWPWIAWSFRNALNKPDKTIRGLTLGQPAWLALTALLLALVFATGSWRVLDSVLVVCFILILTAGGDRRSGALQFALILTWSACLAAIQILPAVGLFGQTRWIAPEPFARERATWTVRSRAQSVENNPFDWHLPSVYDRLSDPDRILPAGGAMGEHRFTALTSGPAIVGLPGSLTPDHWAARVLGARQWVYHQPHVPQTPVREETLPGVFPRLQVYYRARVGADHSNRDWRNEVLLEQPPEVPLSTEPPSKEAELEIVHYGADSVFTQVNLPRDGIVVLNDVFFPGWQAKRDGRDAPLLRANYIARGVYCPAGSHTVRFRYRPASFVAGGTISTLALLGCVLVWAHAGWRRRQTLRQALAAWRVRTSARLRAAATHPPRYPGEAVFAAAQRLALHTDRTVRGAGRAARDFSRSERMLWLFPLLPLLYVVTTTAEVLRFGYFNVDDFNNLFWSNQVAFADLIRFQFQPASEFFRPAGLLWYRALWELFGLNPVPYHLFQGGLNLVNAVLIFLLVRRIGNSRLAAAVASGAWLLAPAMLETFWWFGTIFETLSTTYYLLAFWAFISVRRPILRLAAVLLLYVLAVKTKEMAITLPAILLAYEVIVAGRWRDVFGRSFFVYLVTGLFGLFYLYAKYTTMAAADQGGTYYFEFTASTLGRNMIWYFQNLITKSGALGSNGTLVLILILTMLGFVLKDRILIFTTCFVFLTFLPVIFLGHHLFAFYWYLPAVGAWWWLGQLLRRIRDRFAGNDPVWRVRVSAFLFLTAFSLAIFQGANYREHRINWNREAAAVFRQYVAELRAQPGSAQGNVLVADNVPHFFDSISATTLYQLLHPGSNVEVRVRSKAPPRP